MQLKEHFAIQHAILAFGNGVFEDFHPLGDREEEALFFFFDDFGNTRVVEFRIGFAHFFTKRFD